MSFLEIKPPVIRDPLIFEYLLYKGPPAWVEPCPFQKNLFERMTRPGFVKKLANCFEISVNRSVDILKRGMRFYTSRDFYLKSFCTCNFLFDRTRCKQRVALANMCLFLLIFQIWTV